MRALASPLTTMLLFRAAAVHALAMARTSLADVAIGTSSGQTAMSIYKPSRCP